MVMRRQRTLRVLAVVASGVSMLLAVACAAEAPSDEPLQGVWMVEWDEDDLYMALGGDNNPEARILARANAGRQHLVFEDGRFEIVYVDQGGDVCPGTYEIDGDRLVLTATQDPKEWHCGSDSLGQLVMDARWERESDQLALTDWRLSERPAIDWFSKAVFGSRPLQRAD